MDFGFLFQTENSVGAEFMCMSCHFMLYERWPWKKYFLKLFYHTQVQVFIIKWTAECLKLDCLVPTSRNISQFWNY